MITLFLALAASLPIIPDHVMTPGVVDPVATRQKICTPGYTATVRHVPPSLKKKVFARYKIDPKSDKFEVDHLISLELGGSNDINNLWPQSYTTQPWNARKKDRLENKLRFFICTGVIDMKTAQDDISGDWTVAYKKYVGE